MLVFLLACATGTADVRLGEHPPCDEGFEQRDGACYEVGDDTAGEGDTDTDTDADTDTDTDVDTGPVDEDGDGYPVGNDCDDGDAGVNPGAEEIGWNNVDEDCDGEDVHDWIAISAAGAVTCGIDGNGDGRCWGRTADYNLDAVQPGPFTDIAVGGGYACALGDGGALTCWGAFAPDVAEGAAYADLDIWGSLCGVTRSGGIECSAAGSLASTGYTAVTAGGSYACALDPWGGVDCWDLGIGSVQNYGQAEPPVGAFVEVDAGHAHTCAIVMDGALACWGSEDDGRLNAPAGAFLAVSTGSKHACAIATDETAACWGSDHSGESTPPAVAFVQVSAGESVSCGVHPDGSAECWGLDSYGQATVP